MTDPPNLDEVLAELARVARRIRVYAYKYRSGNVALVVFEDAQAKLSQIMDGMARDPSVTTGGSVWRSRSTSKPDEWAVIVAEDEIDLRSRVEWGVGRPFDLPADMEAALVERHLSQMLNEASTDGRAAFRARYGLGAELGRGGIMRLRAGGDG